MKKSYQKPLSEKISVDLQKPIAFSTVFDDEEEAIDFNTNDTDLWDGELN